MHNIILIFNPSSGSLLAQRGVDARTYLTQLLESLPPTMSVELHELEGLDAELISSGRFDQVWVAGGDGTVLAVATLLRKAQKMASDSGMAPLPLGILPAGTMNLMARDLGMSLELPVAIQQLVSARPEPVDMASLNDEPFFCLSNIGVPVRLTRQREKLRHTSRWIRWPWLFWLLIRSLPEDDRMRVYLKAGQCTHSLSSRSITVTNNPLRETVGTIPARERLDSGVLGIYVTKDNTRWSLTRLLMSLLAGRWKKEPDLLALKTDRVQLDFEGERQAITVMTDGELREVKPPLLYQLYPAAVQMLTPKEAV